jgi:hypothetical protein
MAGRCGNIRGVITRGSYRGMDSSYHGMGYPYRSGVSRFAAGCAQDGLRGSMARAQVRRNKAEGSVFVAAAAGRRMAGSEKRAMRQGTAMKTMGS